MTERVDVEGLRARIEERDLLVLSILNDGPILSEGEIGEMASRVEAINKDLDRAAPSLLAEVAALRATVDRLHKITGDSYMLLPIVPGDAMAFADGNITPHVMRVADEFAIRTEQLAAERREVAALRAAKDKLERELATRMLQVDELAEDIGKIELRAETAEAENEALLNIVKSVEWKGDSAGPNWTCPECCGAREVGGHKDWCAIAAALAAQEPRTDAICAAHERREASK